METRTQLDFSRLYCQLHSMQLITNYCNDEKCLVGLCATCVCSHTQMHAQMGTVPQYQNIRDTFSSLHEQTRNQISLIQQDKNKLGRLREQIQVKKITIKKTIRQLKEQTLQKVRDDFDQLQKKILNDITTQQKKQGFHSHVRFDTLRKNFNRQTQTLINYIEGLNSPSFLEWSKKLKRDLLTQSEVIRKNLQKQLEDNQTYTANLKWNQSYLTDISYIIKKMFSLQFVIPKFNQPPQACFTAVKPNLTLSRASSVPKFSNAFNTTNSSLHKRNQTGSSFFQNDSTSFLKQSLKPKHDEYINCDLSESKIYGKQNTIFRSSMRPSINDDMINRSTLMSSFNYAPRSTIDALRQPQSKLRIL